MKQSKFFCCILFFFILHLKSQELPKDSYNQFDFQHKVNYSDDTLSVKVTNPLASPLRVSFDFPILDDKEISKDALQFLVKENSIFEKKIYAPRLNSVQYNYNWTFGDDKKIVRENQLALPFKKGKSYNVMQSNNGNFSHNEDYSRYAIDFDMKIGDTVTSADDGFVVGVIKDYEYGKNDKNWKDFANYITIYHPQSGLFTQYVHLKKDGSFVKVGDKVERNQPIGLSGATGFVSGEHLHFNVLIPEKGKTLKSFPFTFEKDISSLALKKNMKIQNN